MRKACLGSRNIVTGRKGRRTFAGLPGPTDGFGGHIEPLRLKEEVHRDMSRMDATSDRGGPSVISTGAETGSSCCDMTCTVSGRRMPGRGVTEVKASLR